MTTLHAFDLFGAYVTTVTELYRADAERALLAALARQGVRRAELVDNEGRTVARVEGGIITAAPPAGPGAPEASPAQA